jgi:dihydrofolate reductase
MARPNTAVFIGSSLDGFIARRDGSFDWLDVVDAEGEDYGFATFFGSVDTLLVGRTTWETACRFPEWPYGGKRVVVLTHRAAQGGHGELFWSGEPDAVLARLAAEGARRVYLDGGAVVSQFLAADLVDELTVSLVPYLLGDGIRLFQGGERQPERLLRLASSRAYPSGLVQLTYRPGPAPS